MFYILKNPPFSNALSAGEEGQKFWHLTGQRAQGSGLQPWVLGCPCTVPQRDGARWCQGKGETPTPPGSGLCGGFLLLITDLHPIEALPGARAGRERPNSPQRCLCDPACPVRTRRPCAGGRAHRPACLDVAAARPHTRPSAAPRDRRPPSRSHVPPNPRGVRRDQLPLRSIHSQNGLRAPCADWYSDGLAVY